MCLLKLVVFDVDASLKWIVGNQNLLGTWITEEKIIFKVYITKNNKSFKSRDFKKK